MAKTGDIDPRVGDVVRKARLSNQAFYRHFKSKDELLLAVLTDGQHRLLAHYLEAALDTAAEPAEQVRRWIEGVWTRREPACGRPRPARSRSTATGSPTVPRGGGAPAELLMAPLLAALARAAGRDPGRDADAIYHLTFGAMHATRRAARPPDARRCRPLRQFRDRRCPWSVSCC